jgi:hypothetical protein
MTGRLAWSVCGAAVAMLLAGWVLTVLADDVTPAFDLVVTLALVTFPLVGALVASRRPENAIGWLFCGAGLLFAAASLADGWATYALAERDGTVPGGVTAAWLGSWLFLPPLFGTPQLLFLLFPDGRPLSARWRAAVGLAAAGIVLLAVGAALVPGPIVDAPVEGLANPFGVDGAEVVAGLGWTSGLLSIVLATASLALRFRRARGEERLQLKWFVFAAVLFAVSCAAAGLLFLAHGDLPAGGQLLVLAAFATIPSAAAIAILRYRLYDVDVVVNRTLVYGALTATLAGAYLGCVLLFQLLLSPLTEDSGLAIAGSTLAVAGLFGPARARIQAAVDHRFYRRRYDAARTLEGFTARLRDELDLEALAGDLRGVVRDTVQPAHVSLWLRSRR